MIVTACLYSYPPLRHAGADIFNAHLMEALANAGHEVHVFTTQHATPYTRNGVTIHGNNRDYPRATNVVYTAPDAGTAGFLLATRCRAKLVGIVHNASPPTNARLRRAPWDLIVWNSHASEDHHRSQAPIRGASMVVTPPVHVPDNPQRGDAVTLINLLEDKGAAVWWELAARMPDRPFIGVLSWGPQMTAHPRGIWCPNVTLLPTVPHEHMGDAVWARTGVLLAPSKAEAWGMAAVEALAHGIPVIAHPTPGLTESLGKQGVFADRDDLDLWERKTLHWWVTPTAGTCQRRARQLEAQANDDAARFVAAVEGL
jgi:glycosyltransferase involved in cell wall biosynthesis